QPNEAWAVRYSPDPDKAAEYFRLATDYLDKSKAQRDRAAALRERQRRKSLKYVSAVAIVLSVLLAGAVAAGLNANSARLQAAEASIKANHEAKAAEVAKEQALA